jgi:hypothetical protein
MKVGRIMDSGRGIFAASGIGALLKGVSSVTLLAIAGVVSMTACGSKKSDTPAPKPAAAVVQPSASPAPATSTEKQTQTGAADSTNAVQQSGQAAGSTATGSSGTAAQPAQNNATTVVKVESNQPAQSTITATNNTQTNALNGLLGGAATSFLTHSILKDNPQLATALTTCLFTLGAGLVDSNSILASLQKVTGGTPSANGTAQNTQSAALTGCLTNLVKK